MRARLVRVCVILVTALVATALLPTGRAHAAVEGTDWSGSWDFYASTAFRYTATVPGVRVSGFSNDFSGTRNTVGSVEDTAFDGRCARVLLLAVGVGYIVDKTVCDGQGFATYSTGQFNAPLYVVVLRTLPGGGQDKSHAMLIPSSAEDPDLRTVGTGASWSYYTPTAFQYTVQRPGVRVVGFGSHQSFDRRSALSSVEHTGSGSCSLGRTEGGVTVQEATCVPGEFKNFGRFDFTGSITVEACHAGRCLLTWVPEPW
jgi:hypothetical protein